MDLRIRKTRKSGYSYTLKFNDNIFKRSGFESKKEAFLNANNIITEILIKDINTNDIIQEAMADIIQEEIDNAN